MKIKMHVLVGVAAVVVLALGANLNNYARAEGEGAVVAGEGGSLLVSPSVNRLGDLKPGETYTQEITTVNQGDKDMSFKVLKSSFWIENDNYNDIKSGVSDSQYGKIAEWTDIDSSKVHNVKAGETYKFKYNIAVPADQAGGAQRLMVTISLGTTGGGTFIATETHLNTLIYASVEGDLHPNAAVVSNKIQGFSFSPSISTTSVLENTGDTDLDVTYRVVANDFFNGSEIFSLEEEKILMTDSSRMYEQRWENAPFLGIFNMEQQITLLGEVHTFTGVAIICPVWLIILVAIAIAAIVIYTMRRRKAGKRRARD